MFSSRSFGKKGEVKLGKRWYSGSLRQTMVETRYCLGRVVPERTSQVSRRSEVTFIKRRTSNTRPSSSTTFDCSVFNEIRFLSFFLFVILLSGIITKKSRTSCRAPRGGRQQGDGIETARSAFTPHPSLFAREFHRHSDCKGAVVVIDDDLEHCL